MRFRRNTICGGPQDRIKICCSIYVRIATNTARVWINRVRLPILHVVKLNREREISLSAFAPENLVSRDGFGSPVPRQPAHLNTQTEYCSIYAERDTADHTTPLSPLGLFLATIYFAGYFLARFILSAFPVFFSERIPSLFWLGSLYLVTAAGFVADQSM